MPWRIHTIEPAVTGSNYITSVEHPKDVVANVSPLVAVNTGRDQYTIEYRKSVGASSGVDIWDTGIEFTGRSPHPVTIQVVVKKGSGGGTETPDVADGTGGGAGVTVPTKYKVKHVTGLTTKRKSKMSI